jgi:hypothetical protein
MHTAARESHPARRARSAAPSARLTGEARTRLGAHPGLPRSACACGGGCPKCSARDAGQLAGTRYARDGDAAPADAAQPAEAPAAPQFRDCSERNTGITDANERLETARQRAREFVGAARRVLGAAPGAGTT